MESGWDHVWESSQAIRHQRCDCWQLFVRKPWIGWVRSAIRWSEVEPQEKKMGEDSRWDQSVQSSLASRKVRSWNGCSIGKTTSHVWRLSEVRNTQLIIVISTRPVSRSIFLQPGTSCLIHEPCPPPPTNHHSSLEHATYGTSCLPLAFLSLTTCHLSNPRSINLVWSLSPLSLSLSSFFLCWGFV